MSDFQLNDLIASTSFHVMMCDGCAVRLVNDSRYLWLLAIPQITGISELHDLSDDARHSLMDSASQIAHIIQEKTKADKMNIATIGNIVA